MFYIIDMESLFNWFAHEFVSGVFVPDFLWGKILRKRVFVCLFFEKKSTRCFSSLFICLLCYFLLFKIFIVGMYSVKNGISMILCFISWIWKVCLTGLLMSLFCSIVRVGTRKSCIFP